MLSKVHSLFNQPELPVATKSKEESDADRETDFIVRDLAQVCALEEGDLSTPANKNKLDSLISSPILRIQVLKLNASGYSLGTAEVIKLSHDKAITEILTEVALNGKQIHSQFSCHKIRRPIMEKHVEEIEGRQTAEAPSFMSGPSQPLLSITAGQSGAEDLQTTLAGNVDDVFKIFCDTNFAPKPSFELYPVHEESGSDDDGMKIFATSSNSTKELEAQVETNEPKRPDDKHTPEDQRIHKKLRAARGAYYLSSDFFRKMITDHITEDEIDEMLEELKEQRAHDFAFQINVLEVLGDFGARLLQLNEQVKDLSLAVQGLSEVRTGQTQHEGMVVDMLRRIQGELTSLKFNPPVIQQVVERQQVSAPTPMVPAQIDQETGLLSKQEFDRLPINQRKAYLTCHGSKFTTTSSRAPAPTSKLEAQMVSAPVHKPEVNLRPPLDTFKVPEVVGAIDLTEKLKKFSQMGVDTAPLIETREGLIKIGPQSFKSLRDWLNKSAANNPWPKVAAEYRKVIQTIKDPKVKSFMGMYSHHETILALIDAILVTIQ